MKLHRGDLVRFSGRLWRVASGIEEERKARQWFRNVLRWFICPTLTICMKGVDTDGIQARSDGGTQRGDIHVC